MFRVHGLQLFLMLCVKSFHFNGIELLRLVKIFLQLFCAELVSFQLTFKTIEVAV